MESLAADDGATPFSSVFITSELAQRAPKRTDSLGEKVALQELTALMARAAAEVLPRFVELAMQLTDGVSAGLSLLEPDDLETFRWRHLCGTLSVFEGSPTPRNDSPCGITLDEASPVLTRHSERGYQWIADTKVILPEVLLVPLYIDGPEPLGTLWVVSDEAEHFDSGDARVATELATFLGIALKMKRNEDRLRSSLDAQALLAQEMNHRLKNFFALTQSIVYLSAKGAKDKDGFARAMSDRIQALSSAHALVVPALADDIAPSLDLSSLLEAILRPHQNSDGAARIALGGPHIHCSPSAISSIALIIHELATNSVKHGALGASSGSVDLSWQCKDGLLMLRWCEMGGPAVSAPARAGFGSKLVEAAVHQLDGTIHFDWQPAGVVINISLPRTSVEMLAS